MYKQYINGELVEGEGKLTRVFNPANGEVIASYHAASEQQAIMALEAAQHAYKSWSKTAVDERIKWLLLLRTAILEKKDELLEVLMSESGKTYAQAVADFNQGMNRLAFMAEEGKRIYGVTFPGLATAPGKAYHVVEKKPIGVVVAHIAWNFPVGNAALKIGPIMASGCTGVVKPSGETPLTTMRIGEIAYKIGMPAGIINIIAGSSRELGPVLNGSTIPRMITMIGSSESGREVMRQGASSVKKYSLELGGNAPVIIMPDADIEEAASLAVIRKTSNAGQVCICYNRFYVHTSVYDKFCACVEDKIKTVVLGTGHDSGAIVMGPMINRSARDRMLMLVEDACAKGAKLVYGGYIPQDRTDGNWFMPTFLKDVTDDMLVFKQEIFGPIIAVQAVEDIDEAIQKANNTDCGLTSYVWSHNTRDITKAYEELEFGELYVNGIPNGVHLPHCGIKQSGIGCDNSYFSLDEYFELKRFSMIP